MTVTVPDLVLRLLDAHAELARLGETVDDEWQYVQDLAAVWGARLREVAAARDGQSATTAQVAAVDRLAAETSAITDPHRAIDWLSTLPQAGLLALGEMPG
jgi:hypothetical protein